MSWRQQQRDYWAKMGKRFAVLLLSVSAAAFWLSSWTESEGKRFARDIRWGEIPRSPAAQSAPSESLPYRIESQPPWLGDFSSELPVRRLQELPPEAETLPVPAQAPVPSLAPGGPGKPVESHRPSALGVPSRPTVVAPPADPLQLWVESLLPGILESTLPAFVQIAMERLDQYMQAAGETELTRRFTEQELDLVVVRTIERRSHGQLTDMTARIEGGNFWGSGTVNLGPQKFVVSAKLSVKVYHEKPRVVLREIRVGSQDISRSTLDLLERQINRFIEGQRYPLVLREFQAGNGSVWMSVERV